MLDIVLSLQFLWITVLMIVLSIGLAFACAFLHKHFEYMALGEWLMEHIYCPVARVFLLIIMSMLLFPLVVASTKYVELLALFKQPDFLINLVNILFASGLFFSFLPIVRHPALAMPILACLATAIFFLHLVALPGAMNVSWLPGVSNTLKLVVLIFICYLLCRWLNEHISQWVDRRFIVTGSKHLVSDINYLIFQMPIMLAYGHSLSTQPMH